jgi:hypothetical protein
MTKKPSDRLRNLKKEVDLLKQKRKEVTKIQKIQERER